jgi:uncharacterized protein
MIRAARIDEGTTCHRHFQEWVPRMAAFQTIILQVKVVPGARRDRVAGRYGDGIKIQTSAPPEGGKANAAVSKILAQFLGLKPAQVQLASAAANPRKQFRISGLSAAQLAEKLATLQ